MFVSTVSDVADDNHDPEITPNAGTHFPSFFFNFILKQRQFQAKGHVYFATELKQNVNIFDIFRFCFLLPFAKSPRPDIVEHENKYACFCGVCMS